MLDGLSDGAMTYVLFWTYADVYALARRLYLTVGRSLPTSLAAPERSFTSDVLSQPRLQRGPPLLDTATEHS